MSQSQLLGAYLTAKGINEAKIKYPIRDIYSAVIFAKQQMKKKEARLGYHKIATWTARAGGALGGGMIGAAAGGPSAPVTADAGAKIGGAIGGYAGKGISLVAGRMARGINYAMKRAYGVQGKDRRDAAEVFFSTYRQLNGELDDEKIMAETALHVFYALDLAPLKLPGPHHADWHKSQIAEALRSTTNFTMSQWVSPW